MDFFFGPKGGGVVEAQSHLTMPPVSSVMHAHARSCAYVCTCACTFGCTLWRQKSSQSSLSCVVAVVFQPGGISACVHKNFIIGPRGVQLVGRGPEQD